MTALSQLPGAPMTAPAASDLPQDALIMDGPVAGDPLALLGPLRRALSRSGPAVVVATSGSTGRPKKTVLTAQALTASGAATERATSGPGQWLLCLPAHYVAGVQVLARSVLAGTVPEVMDSGPFTSEGFARAAARLTRPTRYVSLVPTQLQRILDPRHGDPLPDAVAALARFDAVLVGGSALSPALAARARDAGVSVVSTYGMSETCGGCVYNGVPLDTVTVRAIPDAADVDVVPSDPPTARASATPSDSGEGRLWLGGDVVAAGYLDDPAQTGTHFREIDGQRWYRTDDLGRVAHDGTVTVLGRTDDVVNTGGVKVSAGVVAAALQEHPRVRQALAVGVPHPEWGQAVAAVLALRGGALDGPLERELAQKVRERAGAAAVPKMWRGVSELPLLSTGKPDRRAAAQCFAGEDSPSN